jgi:hypothetical protein
MVLGYLDPQAWRRVDVNASLELGGGGWMAPLSFVGLDVGLFFFGGSELCEVTGETAWVFVAFGFCFPAREMGGELPSRDRDGVRSEYGGCFNGSSNVPWSQVLIFFSGCPVRTVREFRCSRNYLYFNPFIHAMLSWILNGG